MRSRSNRTSKGKKPTQIILDSDDVDTEVMDVPVLPAHLQRRAASTWRRGAPLQQEPRTSGVRPVLRAERRKLQQASVQPTEAPTLAEAPAAISSMPAYALSAPVEPSKVPVRRARVTGPVVLSLSALLMLAALGVTGVIVTRIAKRSSLESASSSPPANLLPASTGIVASAREESPTGASTSERLDEKSKHTEANAPPPDGRTPESVQSCMAGFFGAGSFVDGLASDVRFLCEDRDFRGINSLLERVLISHGVGEITPAMVEWSNLGWYQMGATAVLRGACCPPNTAAIKLPRAPRPCDQLDDALQQLVETGTTANSEELAEAYSRAVYCFYLSGVPHSYHYRKPPGPSSRWQFVSFLQHAHR